MNSFLLNTNPELLLMENTMSNYSLGWRKKKAFTKELTDLDKHLLELANEYEDEIKKTGEEIRNIETKDNFFCQEPSFEKFEIQDCSTNVRGPNSLISSRRKNNTQPYANYNSISGIKIRGKHPTFDFHFKKCDDSTYEKMEID